MYNPLSNKGWRVSYHLVISTPLPPALLLSCSPDSLTTFGWRAHHSTIYVSWVIFLIASLTALTIAWLSIIYESIKTASTSSTKSLETGNQVLQKNQTIIGKLPGCLIVRNTFNQRPDSLLTQCIFFCNLPINSSFLSGWYIRSSSVSSKLFSFNYFSIEIPIAGERFPY
jgi:hypothetical protein